MSNKKLRSYERVIDAFADNVKYDTGHIVILVAASHLRTTRHTPSALGYFTTFTAFLQHFTNVKSFNTRDV